MAKTAKAAAKTAAKADARSRARSSDKDLFSELPEAAPRRISGSATRAARPASRPEGSYTAHDIEVLEGLEPVRRRPGMYIGGTDEKALHHLFAEVIDNSMDEALDGHATFIEVALAADGFVTVTDNGRGIPVDPHPKFPNKSALEVIMCTLHAGGKFDSKVYDTSGGLHGVGVSVVNALSERLEVEVAREQTLHRMVFERGKPKGKLEKLGRAPNRRGTKVRFRPDPDIFGAKARFRPERLLQDGALQGLSVRRRRDPLVLRPELLDGVEDVPEEATFHFPDGLKDYLAATINGADPGAPRHLRRHRRQDRRARRRANGRWPGPAMPTASSPPIATPSRRRTAARTRPACAARSSRASRSTPSASARASARPR